MATPLHSIGEIAEQIRGVTYRKQDASTTKRDGYLPILRAGNITDFGLMYEDLVYVPSSKISLRQMVKENDILIAASSGSIEVVGKAARALQDFSGGFGGFCKILRLKAQVDAAYFSHFFKTPEYRRKISSLAAGANINNLKNEHLDSLKIPLPPLAEQKRIAAILDATDALRAKRRETLAQLDAFLKSTFIEMFGDPIANPKSFPVKELAEFYINKKEGVKCGPFGSALKKGELVDSGVPVWNMDNIENSGRMALPFRMWVTEEKYRKLESYTVLDGDILISRAGTVGKMCVARTQGGLSIISTNLIRLRLGNRLLPIYFVSLMTYCKGRVGRLKTGPDGAFTHMGTGVLDTLKFPYPPINLQHRFATIVESVEQQKARMRAHLTELDALFASLQHRAFNGEL
ncbi:MAG: restriction endonuclease subunit S [Salinicola sp.]|uniref:restriction endonuclease subunit S n=1 Tax=Salinicola sp. TaxID=1978524 RepID=UPI001DE668D5|nr:restriction endonuclease subunit S [Salinicola sp.]NRB55513.1 restriction endonuclease subunit S [Salinicola sp.]